MSATTTKKAPLPMPSATPSVLEVPVNDAEATFTPSAELGDQLERMEETQLEIDRKQAEELARLREIQDRD